MAAKSGAKSERIERAARLTFEGRLTEEAIARECGTRRETLWRWKQTPEFRALIDQHRAAARKVEIQYTIADRRQRVRLLEARRQRLHDGFERIVAERGVDMATVPGGASGLLARRPTQYGDEVRVDGGIVALSQELRDLEKQAAIELGQWEADQGGEAEDGFTLLDIAVLMRAARAGGAGDGDGIVAARARVTTRRGRARN